MAGSDTAKDIAMKCVPAILLALLMLTPPAFAAAPLTDAQKNAAAWLSLIDQQNYARGWREGAPTLKTQTTAKDFAAKVAPVRKYLGSVLSRRLLDETFATALPGLPDGHYAVVQYDTKFQHKDKAVETVVLSQQGYAWKTAGYFIR
jgi:hypothetical protein